MQRFDPNNWAAPAQSLAGTVGGNGWGITTLPDGRIAYSDGGSTSNIFTARFHDLTERTVDAYRRSLEWVLQRQRETLIVTLATLVATIVLYIVVPKGFLPLQDTGLITAVTEAGTDVSFTEMQRRQRLVEDAIRSDPDVTGVCLLYTSDAADE